MNIENSVSGVGSNVDLDTMARVILSSIAEEKKSETYLVGCLLHLVQESGAYEHMEYTSLWDYVECELGMPTYIADFLLRSSQDAIFMEEFLSKMRPLIESATLKSEKHSSVLEGL